ncbi:MAG: DUF4861 domain-containing protein [Bacteroidaceae bacterium]|nr:DUF4861 domain-containing protein [Bacteroidaceae bacterium]
MRKISFYTACLLVFSAAQALQAQEKELTLTVSNSWKEAKQNEPVVVNLEKLNLGFTVQSVIVKEGTTEIPSQLDDLNGDGKADEAAFLLDMPAKSKRNITVTLSAEKSDKTYPAQVYAQMMLSDKKKKYPKIQSLTVPGESDVYNCLHHHGPAFESELVAYRIYFDKRQTVDIYGKSRKGFELAETLFYPTDEHKAKGYGDDVLWVGSTCGAGTLKGWENGKPAHIIPTLRTECIRAYGPLRTVVDVIDADWEYQGKTITMTTRYILYGGHRDARVEVSFAEPLGEETFCTGVINVKNSEHFTDHKGLIGCWGTDWPAGANDTIGRKLETVGLAVCIPNRYVKEEQPVTENLLYTVGAKGQEGFTYHISFASLRESFGFKNAKEWFAYMKQWKKELEHPCEVKIGE